MGVFKVTKISISKFISMFYNFNCAFIMMRIICGAYIFIYTFLMTEYR